MKNSMTLQIGDILDSAYRLNQNSVWAFDNFKVNEGQQKELIFRSNVAEKLTDDCMREIIHHHSVDVMDREVKRWIKDIPENGWILDVGGCCAWHWRNLHLDRPDLNVIVVDMVEANFQQALKLCGGQINRNIHLVVGDATALKIRSESIDGYWSVQCLQHIPDLDKALFEATRVLKNNGKFKTYDLNYRKSEKFLFRLLGKERVYGKIVQTENIFIRRSSREVDGIFRKYFSTLNIGYSEFLFKPRCGLKYGVRSIRGLADSMLTNIKILAFLARQHSIAARKNQ